MKTADKGSASQNANATHTPGPWATGGVMTRVEFWPKGWNAAVCVADCHAKGAPESEDERCANARLIAAAPDLLAALKAIVNRADDSPMCWPEFDAARAAIARAEGGGR